MHEPKILPRGPVMADVAAYELDETECERLLDPAIGGVILFRRNFQNPQQLEALCRSIKSLRSPPLVIGVDHEGGRVQRFTEGFTRLPPMAVFGRIWEEEGRETAEEYARQTGWVLAVELAACGVDLSFTPVLDLDWGRCAVIGDRSFHSRPETVTALALALQQGLNRGGMKACGKHFPGHGYAEGDSHLVSPEDPRPFAEIAAADLQPFAALARAGMAAVMPAHVVYPQVDALPAGFSRHWIQTVLRGEIGFAGAVFSDDLTMEGAVVGGGIRERCERFFAAGGDIALVCNRPDLVDELRRGFRPPANPQLAGRWQDMAAAIGPQQARRIMGDEEFEAARARTAALAASANRPGGVPVGEAC